MRKFKILILAIGLFLAFITPSQHLKTPLNVILTQYVKADDLPSKPSNGVLDPKHYLSDKTIQSIVDMNSSFSKSEPKTQVGFYVTDSINGKDPDIYTNDIARAWKIGYSKDNDNAGVMVMFAIKDRKWSIRTSNYINAYYLTTNQIDDMVENIKPELKSGDTDTAIYKLVEELKINLKPKTKSQIEDIKVREKIK